MTCLQSKLVFQNLLKNSNLHSKRSFCVKFQISSSKDVLNAVDRDWNQVYQQENEEIEKRIIKRLTPFQRRRVKLLVDAFSDMSQVELSYTLDKIHNYKQDRVVKLSPNSIRPDWPIELDENDNYINSDKQYMEEEKHLEEIFLNEEFFEKLGMPISIGGGGSGQSAEVKTEEVKEEVVEEVKEKTSFDIELTAYAAGKKIAVIKDVKAVLGLGLKDAKEMVEKAPIV